MSMPHCSSCGRNSFIPYIAPDFAALHDKLRTESGPAFVQPDEVTSVLRNIQRDLEDYGAEFNRIEQAVEDLKQYATQVQSLLSPCRKVPDEILREIFGLCCDTNGFRAIGLQAVHFCYPDYRSKPALAISSVCSRWRRNALSMPVIWSRISLQWKMNAQRKYCPDIQAKAFVSLSNFLDRSQKHPMTVNLDIKRHPFSKSGILHPLLKRFIGQIDRWEDLTFHSDDYSIKELLDSAEIPSTSFPALTKLRYLYLNPLRRDPIPFTDTAPNLRNLSSEHTLSAVHKRFNFLQLSHLDLIPAQVNIRNLFGKCPNLLSLRITESCLGRNDPKMNGCSSELAILTVRHGSNGHTRSKASRSVFPLLTLPSLKALCLEKFKLKMYVDGGKPWYNLDLFMEFVQRSSFQLTTLSVQQLSISDEDLVDILILLPTLKNLTIDDDGFSPGFGSISSSLIVNLQHDCIFGEPAIVPRLRSLKLLNVAAITFNDQAVVAMVESRWDSTRLNDVGTSMQEVDCLRVFTMTFLYRTEEETEGVYSWLADIESEGMMIFLSFHKIIRVGESR